jgi:two-component system phosphate regulon sensor histidine kinase PhoR
MPRVWFTTFIRLATLSAAGLGIGLLYSQPLVGLLIALSIALGWHLYWLFRFDRWLNGSREPYLPEGSGIWPQLFARIDYLKARSRRRSRSLKLLLKQMRQATRSFPDGGIILSANNEIVRMNKVAKELLGLKRKQDRGLQVENLIRDPDFVSYLHAEEYDRSVEIAVPMKVGKWLSCHQVPYGLDQKLLLIRDISGQRQADQMRRDFVANASHELRTPLTVITGYLDALADDESIGPELRGPISEMLRQSNRMRRLVDELLKLSELESEGPVHEGLPVNIAAMMTAATQEAKAMEGCPATIKVSADGDHDLLGEEADIQSVLTNLVSNAVRYTPVDGEIEIRWETDQNGGRLTVADTGVGIDEMHLPRLTERFYRVENGRERIGGEGGTGLGLAIVKHALQRHQATLEIASELGVGSRFTCVFPKARIAAVGQ